MRMHSGGIFNKQNVRSITFIFLLFSTPFSYCKDLLNNELDLLISRNSYAEYFNQIPHSELSSSNTERDRQQDVSINQTGNNNITDINILGYKNNIFTKQIGEGNKINIYQESNDSLTTVEQFGNYNQVIINIQGNNQINRITQIGSHMTAIIRN